MNSVVFRLMGLALVFYASLPLTATYSLKDHHKLLLVSFDGLRWDYPNRRQDLKSFQILQNDGVQAEYLVPPFPTLTSPCHATLATGLYVESHSVVHNVFFNHTTSNTTTEDYFSSLGINEWWDNDYEPIWITASSQGLKSGGYMYPGSNATIGGKTATRSILQTSQTPSDETTYRKRIDDVMTWFIEDDFDFVALYVDQPDNTTHYKGPQDRDVEKILLPLVDRIIYYLFSKIEEFGLKDNLNIIITSDHGMTSIDTTLYGDDVISVHAFVDPSDILFELAIPFGPIGFIEPHPDKKVKIYRQLRDAHPHMQAFYKKDFPERFHFSNNDRIPSIILLADPGHAIYSKFPDFHVHKGDHGYDNQFKDMHAAFYAIGPSFKKNYTVPGFESIHVYELMCHLLGLKPTPNNGSLDVLLPILESDQWFLFQPINMFLLLTALAAVFLNKRWHRPV